MATLNLDVVTGRTIDVSKTAANGSPREWHLRGDVPSSILVRVFYLLEIEQERPELPDLSQPLTLDQINALEAEMVRYEKYVDGEALKILGDIWRWTDPSMTDEKLQELLTPAERRSLIQLFFTGLLARFGKLPLSVTASSSQEDSLSTPTTPTATTQTPSAASSPTSTAPDSTPSATPSQEDSSSAESDQESQTTTETSQEAETPSQAA